MYNRWTPGPHYGDELYHYGVKGMKWGVRKDRKSSSSYAPLSPEVVSALRTKRDKAIFFTGCTKYNRKGRLVRTSSQTANRYARLHAASTMESRLKKNKVNIPEWDFDERESISKWEQASRAYAAQASGRVRVIVGSNMRANNIFETIELPTLKNNPEVTSVVLINSETGKKTIVYERGGQ